MPRTCSISIDIDTLRFYHQIHGLPTPDHTQADPVYTHAMPRFLELFAKLGIRATLFVIGEDLHHPVHKKLLQQAVAEGHELANHTQRHPYRLTQRHPLAIEEEIAHAEAAIEALLPEGKQVVGFRCPGYNTSPEVLSILRKRGYQYDSSVFPCPPYYIAKGLVMSWLSLRGRPSRSMLGSPRVLFAPSQPYQPGENPHTRTKQPRAFTYPTYQRQPNNEALWEIPMPVLAGLPLPFIGTNILLFPALALKLLTPLFARQYPLLNIELHAIDFLDPKVDPFLEQLSNKQPDLSVPLHEKHKRFSSTFSTISNTHSFLPLAEAVPLLS
ncbi:MAG TPA: polysaccharide deacetylase [Myxococcales bacterium]|nr:polysaccharide deacetylase [Deltaproteobacteria bacterium]MBU49665.1 polysaccharide deacetylase [Deltaproteobacteria bacterium]HAA58974.1 polysaccharide deacetylase [Myxococcales bacterium]